MSRLTLIILFVTVCMTSGCAYTNIKMPLDKNFNQTEISTKEGVSSTHTVLYLVSWGDSGSKAAAKQGEISTINYADRQIFSVLFGLYTRLTTVVYGD